VIFTPQKKEQSLAAKTINIFSTALIAPKSFVEESEIIFIAFTRN